MPKIYEVKHLLLSLSIFSFLAEAAEDKTPAKANLYFRDSATKEHFSKKGFQGKVLPEEKASEDSLAEWPSFEQREEILNKLPALRTQLLNLKWDDYAVDEFLFKLSQKDFDPKSAPKKYPMFDSSLLAEASKLSQNTLAKQRAK